MTITLDLQPEIRTGLLSLAEANGMSLEQFVLTLVENAVSRRSPMSPTERAAAWVESAERFPCSPPLSDAAISREDLYDDCG